MMESMESCVPPGFRFHPTDEELVGYYLKKKVASLKIDLDVIRDIDLYRIEPWDLQEKCRIGYEEQNEWYFFSHKDKKYPTGTRTNRATMAGFWKATGRDKSVYDKTKLIGMRKTLVFYKGRAPNGQKSDWIMHEYRLESQENAPPQEEGWVVCRAFKKRTASSSSQNKGLEGWDSSYFYDEPSVVSSVIDPVDYITRHNQQQQQQQQQPQNQNYLSHNFLCKQELEAENLNNNFMNSDLFVQLPQLESPSLPLIKRPSSSLSLNEEEEQLEEQQRECKNPEKVTDWRALDKFVASQLMSQEDIIRYDDQGGGNGVSSFNGNLQSNSDMAALLLLQSGGGRDEDEEEKRLNNVFLNSSSEFCDIGICIFEK